MLIWLVTVCVASKSCWYSHRN